LLLIPATEFNLDLGLQIFAVFKGIRVVEQEVHFFIFFFGRHKLPCLLSKNGLKPLVQLGKDMRIHFRSDDGA
jgi:hypothetical protein